MIKRKPKNRKGILLAALLLMSAATAIPVLAYESPKVVYDEELEAGEVLTDVVFVPDGTELVRFRLSQRMLILWMKLEISPIFQKKM